MRKPQVSRTMETTICEVMYVNVTTEKVGRKTLTLSRHHEDDSRLLGNLRATYDTEEEKILRVESVTYDRKVYAMDEEEFLAHAKVIER